MTRGKFGVDPYIDDGDERRFWYNVNQFGPTPKSCPELGNCYLWELSTNENGYGQMIVDGRIVKCHRLAFFLKHGRWAKPHTLHHCDNPLCVRASHLFEGSASDNSRDKISKGRHAHGDTHGRSKITASDVSDIRRMSADGKSDQELAMMYGLNHNHVRSVIAGRFWKHIKLEEAK